MRIPNPFQPNPLPGSGHRDNPVKTILDSILPPDPKAPERPTIPPPTCDTLPPNVGSLPESLGGRGRRRRR